MENNEIQHLSKFNVKNKISIIILFLLIISFLSFLFFNKTFFSEGENKLAILIHGTATNTITPSPTSTNTPTVTPTFTIAPSFTPTKTPLPLVELQYQDAFRFLQKEKYIEAVELYDEILKTNPFYKDAKEYRAEAYSYLGVDDLLFNVENYTELLISYGGIVAGSMIDAIDSGNYSQDDKEVFLFILGEIGDEDVLNYLIEFIERDDEWYSHLYAVKAIEKISETISIEKAIDPLGILRSKAINYQETLKNDLPMYKLEAQIWQLMISTGNWSGKNERLYSAPNSVGKLIYEFNQKYYILDPSGMAPYKSDVVNKLGIANNNVYYSQIKIDYYGELILAIDHALNYK